MKAATSSHHGNCVSRPGSCGSTTGGVGCSADRPERSGAAWRRRSRSPQGDPLAATPWRRRRSSWTRRGPARRTRSAPRRPCRPACDGRARPCRPGRRSRPTRPGRGRSARSVVRRKSAVAGGRVADRDAEQQPDVEVAAAREQLAVQRPVDDRCRRAPSASRSPGRRRRAPRAAGQLLGLVGAVGVHLADHVVAARRAPPEAVRGTPRRDPALAVAVQHVTCGSAAAIVVGERAGAVGRAVVDDQHVHLGLRPRAAARP